MRKSLWAALVVVVILYLARVPPEESGSAPPSPPAAARADPPAAASGRQAVPAAQAPARARTSLTLVDRRGAEVKLTIDENTEVLVVGSWCVYSRQLNEILRDGIARRYLRDKRLVYVFDYDELVHRAALRVKRGEMTQEALDAYVRSRPPGALLWDQDFLRRVAARQVLFFDETHPIEHDAVPSAFSEPPDRFELNYGIWLTRNLGMPRDVKERLFELHPLETGG